jgi:hypothetical protein
VAQVLICLTAPSSARPWREFRQLSFLVLSALAEMTEDEQKREAALNTLQKQKKI